jgi:hypothetical protein
VRRLLDGSGRGAFPRGPSNWPSPPEAADPARWAADLTLLKEEHAPRLLGRRPPGSRRWTYGDLITGIALHDAYHTGQIQLMKRLWRERRTLGG